MTTVKHFSEGDVNALIPQLEAIFERIEALQNEIGARANELERIGVQPSAEATDSTEAVQERRSYNHDKVLEYHSEIKKIADLGGLLDDLDLKIVDFPSDRNGEPIHLMWQSGQDKVEYYRAPGGDFNKRKRLSA